MSSSAARAAVHPPLREHSDEELRHVVALALAANDERGGGWLSGSCFEGMCVQLGYRGFPGARAITSRFPRGWPGVVELARTPPGWIDRQWLWSARTALAAVRRVCAALGEVPTPDSYDAEVENMRVVDHFTSSDPGRLSLPTAAEVMRAVEGPWPRALLFAGITTPMLRAPSEASYTTAIELCTDAHGALPSERELRAFLAAHRIALKPRPGERYANALVHLYFSRLATDRPLPTFRLPHQRPPFDQQVLHASARSVRGRQTGESDCVEGVARFLLWREHLRPDLEATVTAYRQFKKTTDGLGAPTDRTLRKFGPFEKHAADAARCLRSLDAVAAVEGSDLVRLVAWTSPTPASFAADHLGRTMAQLDGLAQKLEALGVLSVREFARRNATLLATDSTNLIARLAARREALLFGEARVDRVPLKLDQPRRRGRRPTPALTGRPASRTRAASAGDQPTLPLPQGWA